MSYSCMPNMAAIISRHNKVLLTQRIMSTSHTFCSKSKRKHANKGLILFVSCKILHDCCLILLCMLSCICLSSYRNVSIFSPSNCNHHLIISSVCSTSLFFGRITVVASAEFSSLVVLFSACLFCKISLQMSTSS